MPLRALVIANPKSSRYDAEGLLGWLAETFPGSDAVRCVDAGAGDGAERRLADELERAQRAGADRLIAVGGDGTISLAARLLARTGTAGTVALGIVPLGTANVLARELGIPLEPRAAIALAAAAPRTLELDAIGQGSGRYLTQVGVGLDAAMIDDTSVEARHDRGRLAYLTTLVKRAIGYRSHRYLLEVDGRRHRLRAWQVVLANAGTLGMAPFTWGPGIQPGDGVLDLCVYDVRTVRDTVALLLRLLAGRHRHDARARFFRVRRSVTIATAAPLPVQGDGEMIGATPVTLTVVPAAVRVIVPEQVAAIAPAEEPHAAPAVPAHPPPAPDPVAVARARRDPDWRMRLAAWDARALFALNHMALPAAADAVLGVASRLMDHGEGWILLAIALAFLHRPIDPSIPLRVVPPLWLAMLAVNYPIKSLFRRRRPFLVYDRVRVRALKPKDASFPSGHTAAAFAGAVLVAPHLHAFGALAYAYAFVVGWSRVYFGVHFPSDVVIGAGLGALLALALGTIPVFVLGA